MFVTVACNSKTDYYFGYCPLHEFYKQNISEYGCVSFARYKGGKVSTQSGPLEGASLCHWTSKEVISTLVMDNVQINNHVCKVSHTNAVSFQRFEYENLSHRFLDEYDQVPNMSNGKYAKFADSRI